MHCPCSLQVLIFLFCLVSPVVLNQGIWIFVCFEINACFSRFPLWNIREIISYRYNWKVNIRIDIEIYLERTPPPTSVTKHVNRNALLNVRWDPILKMGPKMHIHYFTYPKDNPAFLSSLSYYLIEGRIERFMHIKCKQPLSKFEVS